MSSLQVSSKRMTQGPCKLASQGANGCNCKIPQDSHPLLRWIVCSIQAMNVRFQQISGETSTMFVVADDVNFGLVLPSASRRVFSPSDRNHLTPASEHQHTSKHPSRSTEPGAVKPSVFDAHHRNDAEPDGWSASSAYVPLRLRTPKEPIGRGGGSTRSLLTCIRRFASSQHEKGHTHTLFGRNVSGILE